MLLRFADHEGLDRTELAGPIRRAGQIQIALSHLLNLAVIELSAGRALRVSTDLIEFGEITAENFARVLRDFADLVERVGELYGVQLLGDGLEAVGAGDGDLHLSFHSTLGSGLVVYVDDFYLPFRLRAPARLANPGLPAETSERVLEYFLRRIFRKDSFWEGQYFAIERALRGKDTIVLLPTGAGKSIAFQLAALLLPGATIVVDPILSLIRDQLENLRQYGIDRAVGISSDLRGRGERDAALATLMQGEALFCYVAPERFQIADFRDSLRGLAAFSSIGLIVIDEAHCVSEWGHDFRTAYLRLGDVSRESCRADTWTPPLLALTGTASSAVLRDLQRELDIRDFEAVIKPATFDRKELDFSILKCSTDQKSSVLRNLVGIRLPAEFGVPASSFFRSADDRTYSGLVFCPHVNGDHGVVAVCAALRSSGIPAAFTSGKAPKGEAAGSWQGLKAATERSFKKNEIPVLVCTKAFGMGIDKPNVRYTVHYGIPQSIEAFYQEAGRAGRDRGRAICTVVASNDYVDRNARLLAPGTTVEEVARAVEQTPWAEADDVTRALWFHTRSFAGIDQELAVVAEVLERFGETATERRSELVVPASRDAGARLEMRSRYEKALHRLVIVGLVDDYIVHYSASSFDVRLTGASQRQMSDSFVNYVAAYQTSRARVERERANSLRADDRPAFVLALVRHYLEFVYEVIESGRRRAVAEMLGACAAGRSEEFRARVLRYFEATEYSALLENMLTDPEGGLSLLPRLLEAIDTPSDAAKVRGQVSRYLESYPDHPAFLAARGASEALSLDVDWNTANQNLDAFLSSALDRYSVSEGNLVEASAALIRALMLRNEELAGLFERCILGVLKERESIRQLVSLSSVSECRYAPWKLLLEVSGAADAPAIR